MTAQTPNFNCLGEAMNAVHQLRLRAFKGEEVQDEMGQALQAIDSHPSANLEDTISLLYLAQYAIDPMVHRLDPDNVTADGINIAKAWLRIDRALQDLERLAKEIHVSNGSQVN